MNTPLKTIIADAKQIIGTHNILMYLSKNLEILLGAKVYITGSYALQYHTGVLERRVHDYDLLVVPTDDENRQKVQCMLNALSDCKLLRPTADYGKGVNSWYYMVTFGKILKNVNILLKEGNGTPPTEDGVVLPEHILEWKAKANRSKDRKDLAKFGIQIEGQSEEGIRKSIFNTLEMLSRQ